MDQKNAPGPTPAPAQKVSPLAIALLNGINNGSVDPTVLVEEKKRLCVKFLMSQFVYTNFEIGEIMKMSLATVKRYKKKAREDNSLAQLMIEESEVAMDLIEAADLHAGKLTKEGKHKDAWTVRRECVEMLQSLGYVKKVEQKLNVKGSLNLLQILNLELELREKESPDNGEDNDESHNGNGNGHSGAEQQSSSRLEDALPE